MKLLFIFSLFLISPKTIFAESYYFDFEANFPAVKVGDVFAVKFKYELKGYKASDFRVRMQSENFCVLDEFKICINGKDLWEEMPPLRQTLTLKAVKPFEKSTEAYFLVQNTKTGEIYKTPVKTLWEKGEYSSYVRNLNRKILLEAPTAIFEEKDSDDKISQCKLSKDGVRCFWLWLLSLVFPH